VSRLHSLVYLLPQLWRTLFTRPITVGYPFARLELPSYFRGRVVIDMDLCRGCGSCVRNCPAFALELERERGGLSASKARDRFRLIHYPDRCAYCGECEASCAFGAIALMNEFVPATPDRDMLAQVMVKRGDDRSGG